MALVPLGYLHRSVTNVVLDGDVPPAFDDNELCERDLVLLF